MIYVLVSEHHQHLSFCKRPSSWFMFL